MADVTFQEPGDYVLRAVASDGSHFSYENVMVEVTPLTELRLPIDTALTS